MRGRWQVGIAIVIAMPALASVALGHGDVHERIEELTEKIEGEPGNAALYVRRGSLYALDESWEQALADYESASRLDPNLPKIDFLKAKMLVALDQHERGVALLDSFLSGEPQHADGYLVRARAHVAQGHIDAAIDDYTRAIALFKRPAPRYYLERVRVLLDAGRIDEALEGLRQGVADLGPLASLVEVAVKEEEKRGNYEEALRWADLLSPTLRHSPRWRATAGNLASRAGYASQAEHEYREGLAAIEALPPARRGTEAMIRLRTELTRHLIEPHPPGASTQGATPLATGPIGRGLALGLLIVLLGWLFFRRTS
jgi:tetratricopeptide (TPR) repeat protein